MSEYSPPVDDIMFTLRTVAAIDEIAEMDDFAEFDAGYVEPMLEEAGRFAAEVIAPLNRVGDQQGASLQADGTVVTPEGWADAYQRYVQGGWGAVPFDPEYGGGGLPLVIGVAIQEMVTASSMAFSLCPMLTQGSIHMLSAHGSEEQKNLWLPKLVSGEWAGTMNLTEPAAGSDVGAVATRAERRDDGTYRIHGQKIFITYGEHEMTDNIVHLVLARTPDSAPGTRGISCFIVPKYLVDESGGIGARNDVSCVSLEHKMGIHASPTCVLQFGGTDGAVGYLIGEEQQGMGYMFTMMNHARLTVGLEGLAVADRAFQLARAFAHDRTQGRAPDTPPGQQAAIVDHPDVRRMLLTMKAYTEAMRCLIYANGAAFDIAEHHRDPERRAAATERVEILTPLGKAWCTDIGSEVASLGIQVHGGMGYIEEAGAAQHYRDVRIAAIYEGTNGIQAIDLVTRKLRLRDGAAIDDLLAEVSAVESELTGDLAPLWPPLGEALDGVRKTTEWMLTNPGPDALAGATPYLRQMATLVAGWLLARSAAVAAGTNRGGLTPDQADDKIGTARFFLEQLLPQVNGLAPTITAGNSILEEAHL
jgi:alkylation response protein AidB-like acyl-CoA dehydrogenase